MILLVLLFTLTLSMIIIALSGSDIQKKAGDRFTEYAVVLFLIFWFAAVRDVAPLPVWMPYLTTILFLAILVASLVLAVRPPKIMAWAGERRFMRHDIEAIVMDMVIWLMMLSFGIPVLGRFQW